MEIQRFNPQLSQGQTSTQIIEILTEWEEDLSTPIDLNEASNEVIDNLKFEYPNL